ncbi:MAG: helix-turn-helix domain-containing protein [Chloroflexota bacterium]
MIRALRNARRRANLTQAKVAERMGTTRPAVARLENDHEGRITLHLYLDYALACGMLPLNVVLEPVESVRQFAIDRPNTPRTQANYQVWVEREAGATADILPPSLRSFFEAALGTGASGSTEVIVPTILAQAAPGNQGYPGVALNSPDAFQFDLRAGVAPDDRIYVSVAPLDTDNHFRYLHDLEAGVIGATA